MGPPSILSSFLELSILNQNNNTSNNLSQVIPPIAACGLDTLNFVINTAGGVHYLLEGYLMNSPAPNAGDTTNSLVIQPFHLSAVLHLPQLVVWGLVLIVFAWLFGDDSKSF